MTGTSKDTMADNIVTVCRW